MKTNRIRLALVGVLIAVALFSMWSATRGSTPLTSTPSAAPSKTGSRAATSGNSPVEASRARLLAAISAHGNGGAPGPSLQAAMPSELNPTRELEARYMSEAKSKRWSTIEEVIEDVFVEQTVPDAKLVSAECRNTLCRTDFALSGEPMTVLAAVSEAAKEDATLALTTGRHRLENGHLIIYTAPPGLSIDGTVATP